MNRWLVFFVFCVAVISPVITVRIWRNVVLKHEETVATQPAVDEDSGNSTRWREGVRA